MDKVKVPKKKIVRFSNNGKKAVVKKISKTGKGFRLLSRLVDRVFDDRIRMWSDHSDHSNWDNHSDSPF